MANSTIAPVIRIGGKGNESLDGGAGNDTLNGGEGNDSLDGGSGNDSLSGGDGNDVFELSYGDDTADGGAGIDIVSYGSVQSGVTVDLSRTGSQPTGGGGNDTLIDIENVFGSAGNDSLTGASGDNSINGYWGNDTLDGGGGNDALVGGTGNDSLLGGDGNDTLAGNAGDDVLDGEGGVDLASYSDASAGVTVSLALPGRQDTGGAGTDTLANIESLTGSAHNDSLTGSDSNNVIRGGAGNDTLVGGGGADKLIGGQDDDSLIGGAGDDTLDGGAGDDSLSGGDGNDVFEVSYGDDTADGGAGIDTASYGSLQTGVSVSLSVISLTAEGVSEVENEKLLSIENLFGSAGNDTLTGSIGDNLLHGYRGDDEINGGGGNDTLLGWGGNDTLIGGDGDDILIGGTGDDIIEGGPGKNTIIWRPGDGDDIVTLGDGTNILLGDGTNLLDPEGKIGPDWSVQVVGNAGIFTHKSGGSVTVTDYQQGIYSDDPTCILPGTLITTPEGPRPIESLAPGDMVATPEGPRAVRWVGRSQYSMAFLQGKPMSMPVCIHAGALGEGLPARDLWVSPWHAVLFGETLVRAFDLINCQNVTQDYRRALVSFYNVRLDSPDIIFAEDVPVETYANHNNRALFHNLDEYLALYGSHAPSWMGADGVGIRRHKLLDKNAPELAPIRQAVLARAAASPGMAAA